MGPQFKSSLKNGRLKGTALPRRGTTPTRSDFENSDRNSTSESALSDILKRVLSISPAPLTPPEIHNLFFGFGIGSLQTLIGDASESSAAVRQMKKEWSARLTAEFFDGRNQDLNIPNILCELSFAVQAWRIRLDILEMIANAHYTLNAAARSQKNTNFKSSVRKLDSR